MLISTAYAQAAGGSTEQQILGFLPIIYNKFGCMGVIVVGALVFFFSGGLGSIGSMVGGGTGTTPQAQVQGGSTAAESCNLNASSRLTCNGLASVNATWAQLMQGYRPPKLVFYAGNGQ